MESNINPAVNAPTMGASPIKCAIYAKRKPTINAKANFIPEPGLSEDIHLLRGLAIMPPRIVPPANNRMDNIIVWRTLKIEIVPVCTMALTMARSTNPITSSMTAAPSTIRDSFEDKMEKSLNTLAVMPTEVAESVAPRKRYAFSDKPGINSGPAIYLPKMNGKITPILATSKARNPTFFISLTFDSKPT